MLCSCSVRRSSWPSGSDMLSDATRIDARMPSPASIVTTSRSIRSGICLSISSMRCAALELDVVRRARTSRPTPAATASTTAKMIDPPIAGTSHRTSERERDRGEHLVAEELARRRAVHARRRRASRGSSPRRSGRLRRATQSPSRPAIESSGRACGRLGLRAAGRLGDVAVRLDLVDASRTIRLGLAEVHDEDHDAGSEEQNACDCDQLETHAHTSRSRRFA